MGSIITRAKKLRLYRFITQIVSLVLLNLQFLNIWLPSLTLTGMLGVCAPGFYCHGCPWATMACPIGILVNFSKLGVFPVLALGTLGLFGALAGRFVCGWICPFGWLQDMLYKIRTRKFHMPPALRYVKYAMLVVFVIGIPYMMGARMFGLSTANRATFCDICPSGFLEALIPYASMGGWNTDSGLFAGFNSLFFIKAGITLGVVLMSVFIARGFCRMFCPLGAIFGLFNKFSLFRYNLTYHKCNGCGACAKVCPVEIDPVKQINDAECIRCYECTNTKHLKFGAK